MRTLSIQTTEIKRKNRFQALNSQLADFGLNPSDWTLFHEPRCSASPLQRFRIQNNKDSSLHLFGYVKMHGPLCKAHWESIEFAGAA